MSHSNSSRIFFVPKLKRILHENKRSWKLMRLFKLFLNTVSIILDISFSFAYFFERKVLCTLNDHREKKSVFPKNSISMKLVKMLACIFVPKTKPFRFKKAMDFKTFWMEKKLVLSQCVKCSIVTCNKFIISVNLAKLSNKLEKVMYSCLPSSRLRGDSGMESPSLPLKVLLAVLLLPPKE